MKKAKRKFKAKKQKKAEVRAWLTDVNQHCAQLSVALRHLADTIDNVRSYHLGEEK
jgi:hypothetical protein